MQYQRGGNSPGPLERQFADLGNRLKKNSGQRLLFLALILLAVSSLSSAFYKVDTEESGVLLRFGRLHRVSPPGLHFKLPFGIDRVYKAKTGRAEREEFGFRSVEIGTRTTYTTRGLEDESLTLTGDLNVSNVEWIVQYQIADPVKFLFHIRDPRATIRDMAEATVRKVVGNSNVSEVLTTERAALADATARDLQQILNQYDIGVRIVTVRFQDVNPPNAVKAAFNEVNEAEQQKESMILQAREQYNREVPMARGTARRTVQGAEGYAIERINRAQGESSRFLALRDQYRQAPKVTRQRLYLETMEIILSELDEIYIMDSQGGGALPLLPLRSATKGGQQ